MSWAFKLVGDAKGLIEAMDKGGGQFDVSSGRVTVPQSYTRACSEIVNHITLQSQTPEIGWQIEAWGGGPSYHIDVQPVNLRLSGPGRSET